MQTRAMAWGVEKEAEAVLKYQVRSPDSCY